MRKILPLGFGALLLLSAKAEGAASEAGFSWETLASGAGAAAATLLVVQYLKEPLDRVFKIPTRAFAYAVAFLISLGAQAFGAEGLQLKNVPIVMLNAFMVAFTAMGAYETTFSRRDRAVKAGGL